MSTVWDIERQRKEFEKERRVYGNPGNLKIKGFIPINEEITYNEMRRYSIPWNLKLSCPKCGSNTEVYEDNWHPNYNSGDTSGFSGPNGTTTSENCPHEVKYGI